MGNTDWIMLEMPSDTLHTVGVGTGMEETQREASIVAIYGSVEDMVNSMLGRKWEYGFLEVPGQTMTPVRPGAMGRRLSTSILAWYTMLIHKQGRKPQTRTGLDVEMYGHHVQLGARHGFLAQVVMAAWVREMGGAGEDSILAKNRGE